ncbi:MAG: trehalose-phosphatase [Chloroflexi bacterium]|nr:trehalose-phosphatase [Chloroflexota bacterium]
MSEGPPAPPNLMANLDSILPIVASDHRFGLVVDFDGTISEIVSTPDEAGVSLQASNALSSLAAKLALVSVMSGRAASDVVQKVGIEGLLYVGNHGAEYIIDSRLNLAPNAAYGREAVRHVFNRLQAAVDVSGLIWQDKGYSASVHYRLASNTEEARRTLTDALGLIPEAKEIEVFWGKLVLELRASHGLDKGYAIRKLVKDYNLDSVIFIGDDTTDLDALIAVNELVTRNAIGGAGVVVLHEDSPVALLEAADYSVEGVSGVARFLSWLDGVTV